MNYIFRRLGFFRIKVHSLLFINVSLILGIIWQKYNYSYLSLIAFLFFIIIKLLIYKEFNKNNLLKLFYILLTFNLGSFLYFHQQQKFYNFQNVTNKKTYNIIGTIINISIDENNKGSLILRINQIQEKNTKNWESICGDLQIHVNDIKNLKVDDLIKIYNVTFNYKKNSSYDTYLIKEDLSSSIFVYKFAYQLLFRPNYSIRRYIFEKQQQLFKKTKSKLSESTFALFSSIFLGNKIAVKSQMIKNKDYFQLWGLSHYLARSGLHLAIIGKTWNYILSFLCISFTFKNIFSILLILIYHLLSWPSIPFIRSIFMFFLFKICNFFNWQSNSLHLLNLTLFTILIVNPIQLFFLDFQLSFALTYAIIWICHLSSLVKAKQLLI